MGVEAPIVTYVRHVVCGCVLAGVLAGCEGSPAEAVRQAATQRYVADDGGFRIDYMSPPWTVVERSGESLDLEIIAELFGEPLEGSEPTHLFQIAYVDVSDGLAALADLEAEGGTDTDAVGDWGTTGDLPELPGDAGDDVVPEYLRGVDLREPGAVALAELDHLLIAKEARLDLPPASFVTASGRRGIVYQVVVPPGAFVRAYYVPAHRAVVRAAFVSVFDLDSTDVAMMAETMHTGEESP